MNEMVHSFNIRNFIMSREDIQGIILIPLVFVLCIFHVELSEFVGFIFRSLLQ